MSELKRLQEIVALAGKLSAEGRAVLRGELLGATERPNVVGHALYGSNIWKKRIGKGRKRYWYGMSPAARRAEVRRRMG